MRSNVDILDGTANDPGMVGVMSKQMLDMGATTCRVITADARNNDEALIFIAVGKKNIASYKAALDAEEKRIDEIVAREAKAKRTQPAGKGAP